MDNLFLDFLEAYKSLDELCKQILKSNKGISKYIEEMDSDIYGKRYVSCWEQDYKKLKNMRWIRNQLVHEVNSFNDYRISYDDVEWLKNFRTRILSCTDPFSLLNQARNEMRGKQQINSTNSNMINLTTNIKRHTTSRKITYNKTISDKIIYLLVIIVVLLIVFLFSDFLF